MIGSVCARDIHRTTFNALSTHQLLLFICLFLVFSSLSRSLGVFRCSFSISLREYNTCVLCVCVCGGKKERKYTQKPTAIRLSLKIIGARIKYF